MLVVIANEKGKAQALNLIWSILSKCEL